MQVNFAVTPPTYLFDGTWRKMQVLTEHVPVAGAARPRSPSTGRSTAR